MSYSSQSTNHDPPRHWCHLHQAQAPIPQPLQAQPPNGALFPPCSAHVLWHMYSKHQFVIILNISKKLWVCSTHLLGTSIFMMPVSRSSPYRSVQVARTQRWSWDKQYPTNRTLYFWDASPKVSPSSVCLSLTGARMNGGVYRRRHSGLCKREDLRI